MTAKGVRNIILGKIEVLGPCPAEVRYVENKLGDDPKAAIAELPDSLVETWLNEFEGEKHKLEGERRRLL